MKQPKSYHGEYYKSHWRETLEEERNSGNAWRSMEIVGCKRACWPVRDGDWQP